MGNLGPTAFTFSDVRCPGKAARAGDLIELAQHHLAKMAELIGVSDEEIATAITTRPSRAVFLAVLDGDKRPEASSLLFYDPNDRSEFRTLYCVMVADSPDYSFRDLAERADNGAKSVGPGPFQYLDIVATGAIGLDGYSIRESAPGRVAVGKFILSA